MFATLEKAVCAENRRRRMLEGPSDRIRIFEDPVHVQSPAGARPGLARVGRDLVTGALRIEMPPFVDALAQVTTN